MKTYHEKISKQLNVSPQRAWELISAVEGVDKWFASLIKTCEVTDGKRVCHTHDGQSLEEQVLEVNDETKTFRFAIQKQTMLPIENIIETMTVTSDENGQAIVDWSASFEAAEENALIGQEAFRNLWNMGLAEMEKFINQKN